MESVASDPELASEMLALMNKELKKTRARIEQLEGNGANNPARVDAQLVELQLQERAESAETAMKALQETLEAVASENTLLRVALDEIQDKKVKIKQENSDKSLEIRASKQMESKGVSTDAPEENEQTREHIRKLEEALEKYYTKYKAGKESRKEITEEHERFQRQVTTLECEAGELRTKLVSLQQKSSKDLPPSETCSGLLQYMESLPMVPKKPSRVAPILGEDIDLKEYLLSDPRTLRYCTHILYLPGLLTWAKGKTHALVSGPISFLDARNNWVQGSKFKGLYGNTFHLFHHHRERIFYYGFYKAIDFRSKNPDGFDRFSNVSYQALAESAMAENHKVNKAKFAILSELYEARVLKVENMGLQCVGFDTQLYDRLKDRYEIYLLAQPVEKRKLEFLYPDIVGNTTKANPSSPSSPKKKKSN